jgi:hypothetical protein
VLQSPPLKKNLVLRFGTRIRQGENTISLLSRDYKRRLHGFEDYNTRGSRGITAKNKLIQLTTSLEIDEDGDSGKAIEKRLSRTWRMPNRARNWRLVPRSSRTLNLRTLGELELLQQKPDPFFSSHTITLTSDPCSASNGWISYLCLQPLPSQLFPKLLPPEHGRRESTMRALCFGSGDG